MAKREKTDIEELPDDLSLDVSDFDENDPVLIKFRQMGFDPLEMSIKISKGEELQTTHPFLKVLDGWIMQWKKAWQVNKEATIDEQDLNELYRLAEPYLLGKYTPIDIRSKHILELVQYIHAKKKAIDLKVSGQLGLPTTVMPLNNDEIKKFKSYFKENY